MKFLSSFVIVLVSLLFAGKVVAQELPPTPIVQDTTYDVAFQPAGAVLQQLDMNGGILLSSGDDVNDIVSIGFDFIFFGNTFNTVNVSSNGFISFSDFGNGCCGGELQFGSPNTIYALWMDLVANNSTYYKTYDLNGQSVFTAGWYNAYELGSPSTFHNFEISLFSGTNDFKITYGNNMAPASPYSAGIVGPMGEIYAIQPYGIDQSIISNTTYTFSLAAAPPPEPPIAVDCNIAPSDPSCAINNIIDTITEPNDQPIIADNTMTPEESVALFAEPITETPVEEVVTPVVEEQPIEQLLAVTPEQSSPEQETIQEAAQELVAEENSKEETAESNTKEEVVASTNESSGSGSLDPSLLSLVLSIIDSTSTTASATTNTVTGGSSATNSSTSAQQSAAAAVSSVSSAENIISTFDSLTQQQEQLFFSSTSESNSNRTAETNNSTTTSATTELKEMSELFVSSTETQTTLDLNNPVAAASSVTNNFANQEAAGLLNFNEEFRVSMNDDSNENFMGEDQSTTINAMSAGVDFSSYTSAMLFDASAWYKPEDIYKNNKISDNARSLYFLQKGSSDTFNQMVQEQYK